MIVNVDDFFGGYGHTLESVIIFSACSGDTIPPDTTYLIPSSIVIFSSVYSLGSAKTMNPEVGFGVVGIKTFIWLSPVRRLNSPLVSPVTKAIA